MGLECVYGRETEVQQNLAPEQLDSLFVFFSESITMYPAMVTFVRTYNFNVSIYIF